MSFASPLWLAALALIPIAIVGRGRRAPARPALRGPVSRRSRRFALAAARRPRRGGVTSRPRARWRRSPRSRWRSPGPHVSYSAPVDQASVMLVTDHSGLDGRDRRPADPAGRRRARRQHFHRSAARRTCSSARSRSRARPTPSRRRWPTTRAARAIIDEQTANGSTATGDALQLALQLLRGADKKHPPSAIVLLSDGAANAGVDVTTVAREAAQEKIPIDTVALGTPNGVLPSPDPFAAARRPSLPTRS